MEAVSHAGTCLGLVASDGIVLAAERRNLHKLLEETAFSEKLYRINDDLSIAVAGITADANVLMDEMRLIAQRHLLQFQEPIPVEQLVTQICDLKHGYTMFGGRRPFGVSILFMGWDKQHGFQLYQSDPSGNYSGWKATCIGSNCAAANSMLETEYKSGEETLDTTQSLDLCVKVLHKTMTMSKLTSDKVEIATLSRRDGRTRLSLVPQKEVGRLLLALDESEKEAGKAGKGAARAAT